jgi:hypothetical protein
MHHFGSKKNERVLGAEAHTWLFAASAANPDFVTLFY